MSRDSFVEVQRAFFEAPPEYIGQQVWVRWDSRCVRIFNDRMEQVQIHLRLEPGKFSRISGCWRHERSGALLLPMVDRARGAARRSLRPMGAGQR